LSSSSYGREIKGKTLWPRWIGGTEKGLHTTK
jgi:hypothetical protein